MLIVADFSIHKTEAPPKYQFATFCTADNGASVKAAASVWPLIAVVATESFSNIIETVLVKMPVSPTATD